MIRPIKLLDAGGLSQFGDDDVLAVDAIVPATGTELTLGGDSDTVHVPGTLVIDNVIPVPTVDDFIDDGHRWTPFGTFVTQTIYQPSVTGLLMPSSGVVGAAFKPGILFDGGIVAPSWGHVLGDDGPCVAVWRFALPADDTQTINDTECEYGFGVVAIDGDGAPTSSVMFYARWDTVGDDHVRAWVLRTLSDAGNNDRTLTLDVTGKSWMDVRLSITPAGTTCEVRLDDGDWATLLVGTDAPDPKIYIPIWTAFSVGDAERFGTSDSSSWDGPRSNDDSPTNISDGDKWPFPSTVTYGEDSNTACEGNDGRLSDARTPTAHAASHQNGGSDEIATATPAASAIPKADGSGTLNDWITAAPRALSIGDDSLGAPLDIYGATITLHGDGGGSIVLHEGADFNGQPGINLADPNDPQDASTKSYTDQPQTRASSSTTPTAISGGDIGGFIKLTNAGAITLPTANLSSALVSGRSLLITVILTGGGTLTISDGSGCTHSGTPGALSCVLWSDDGVTWYVR